MAPTIRRGVHGTLSKIGTTVAGDRLTTNTTSGARLLGNFGQTNYATAKSAIVGMTLTLNLELAKIGVTSNVIGPRGITRISATMSGAAIRGPDEIPDDEFDPPRHRLGYKGVESCELHSTTATCRPMRCSATSRGSVSRR